MHIHGTPWDSAGKEGHLDRWDRKRPELGRSGGRDTAGHETIQDKLPQGKKQRGESGDLAAQNLLEGVKKKISPGPDNGQHGIRRVSGEGRRLQSGMGGDYV